MKELAVNFKPHEVRATLAGRMSQFRRAIKCIQQPDEWRPIGPARFNPTIFDRHGDEVPGPEAFGAGNDDGSDWVRCPYGQPGDRLWVRETWALHVHAMSADRDEDGPFVYAADGQRALSMRLSSKWTPSIHMPRWASRITLEVTGVRVERLQDISEADAQAEGCAFPLAYEGPDPPYRTAYARLWESINGAGSWDANPWVWVVEFKRVEA